MSAQRGAMSRPAVVSIGVSMVMISLIVLPALPMVLPAVCVWWLTDDLTRRPDRRPSWLGGAALLMFTVVAVAGVTAMTIFDARVDCGADIFGGLDDGLGGATSVDSDCVNPKLWRSVVGVSLTLLVCAAGAFSVRRSDTSTPPLAVAARTFGIMLSVVVVSTLILIFT